MKTGLIVDAPPVIIDADLVKPQDPLSTIHVWYSFGGKEHQMDLCAFAFHHWLPIPVRKSFGFELRNYWYSIHPWLRNDHLAAFLTSLIEEAQPFVSLLQPA